MTEQPLPTQLIELEIGEKKLQLKQLANLEAVARKSVIEKEDPYWGYLWPSAIALARLVSEAEVEGKRLLDLGCGLGAVGITAAALGADVLLSDIRPEALTLSKENAQLNGLEVQTLQLDFTAPPADLGRFDMIVASDVFYEDGMMGAVLRFIRKHLDPEGLAWITDPMRVIEAGVLGAARLNGLEAEAHLLQPGHGMTSGVMLYEIQPRRRAK